MNLLDYFVLLVLAFFTIYGFYRGFMSTVLNTAAFFVSWLCAVLFSPSSSKLIQRMPVIYNMVSFYAEGGELVSSIELARTNVLSLSAAEMDEAVRTSMLYSPLDRLVKMNLSSEVFAKDKLTNVGQYFNETIVRFSLHLLAFFAIFLVVRLVLALVINGYDFAKGFPVLRRFDAPIAAGFGLLRGLFALFLVFMAVPLMLTAFYKMTILTDLVNNSYFSSLFYKANFLLTFIKGA